MGLSDNTRIYYSNVKFHPRHSFPRHVGGSCEKGVAGGVELKAYVVDVSNRIDCSYFFFLMSPFVLCSHSRRLLLRRMAWNLARWLDGSDQFNHSLWLSRSACCVRWSVEWTLFCGGRSITMKSDRALACSKISKLAWRRGNFIRWHSCSGKWLRLWITESPSDSSSNVWM